MPGLKKDYPLDGHTIVRLKDACTMIGFSAKHIRQLEKAGQFPPRVQLGPKSVGFRLKDLRAWIDSRLIETGDVTRSGTKPEGEA